MNVSVYAIPGIIRLNSPDNIFQAVCYLYKLEPENVLQKRKSREREFVEVRQLTMTLIREKLGMSFNNAGAFFRLDHATAMHAKKTVFNLRETNKLFRKKTDILFNSHG